MSNVIERNQRLLDSGSWSDCSFLVGTDSCDSSEQLLRAHKLFLATATPVFDAMLLGPLAESEPIVITDVDADAFKSLLQFIYTDKININSFEQASKLYYAAKKYLLPDLVETCRSYLLSNLNPQNVCQAYEFAQLHDDRSLIQKSREFICAQTEQVLRENSFDKVELDTLHMIFERDDINVKSEIDLFNALSRYATKHLINGNLESKKHPIKCPGTSKAISSESILDPSFLEDGAINLTVADNTDNAEEQPKHDNIGIRRLTVKDVVMKIRFLTLTPQQFAEIPDNCQLLSESEKFTILMNICSTNSTVAMPSGFSTIKKNRNAIDKAPIPAVSSLNISPAMSFHFPLSNASQTQGPFTFLKT